jgi:sugar phosphate isomerase/epimerase
MRLSIQENLIPGKTLAEKLQKIEKYGFEGIEIWGNDLPQRFKEIKDALSVSRIKLSTICRWVWWRSSRIRPKDKGNGY